MVQLMPTTVMRHARLVGLGGAIANAAVLRFDRFVDLNADDTAKGP